MTRIIPEEAYKIPVQECYLCAGSDGGLAISAFGTDATGQCYCCIKITLRNNVNNGLIYTFATDTDSKEKFVDHLAPNIETFTDSNELLVTRYPICINPGETIGVIHGRIYQLLMNHDSPFKNGFVDALKHNVARNIANGLGSYSTTS